MTTHAHSVVALIKASRPKLKCFADKICFAVHSVIAINGLKLLAVGIRANSDPPGADAPEVSVDGWNDEENEYSFLYGFDCQSVSSKSGESASSLLVKCLTLNNTLIVTMFATNGPQAPETIEIDIMVHAVPDGVDSANKEAVLSAVGQFTCMQELVDRIQAALESQIHPSSSKPSLSTSKTEATVTTSRVNISDLNNDPDLVQSSNGVRGQEYLPGYNPLMVGRGDILPGGDVQVHDPLRVGLPHRGGLPGGPVGGGLPGGPVGGGMHVGPDHPFFANHMRNPLLIGGGRRGTGGLYGPPGLPQGARWDPISPEGLPGWSPGDFQQPGRPSRGGPPVHPDMMQPGALEGGHWDHMNS